MNSPRADTSPKNPVCAVPGRITSEIADPEALDAALSRIPGVVEHGLFIGLASVVIIAGADGVRVMGNLV